jgi:hypothetical protein
MSDSLSFVEFSASPAPTPLPTSNGSPAPMDEDDIMAGTEAPVKSEPVPAVQPLPPPPAAAADKEKEERFVRVISLSLSSKVRRPFADGRVSSWSLGCRKKRSLGLDEKKRGKRLFGGLLGTLSAFKVRVPLSPYPYPKENHIRMLTPSRWNPVERGGKARRVRGCEAAKPDHGPDPDKAPERDDGPSGAEYEREGA